MTGISIQQWPPAISESRKTEICTCDGWISVLWITIWIYPLIGFNKDLLMSRNIFVFLYPLWLPVEMSHNSGDEWWCIAGHLKYALLLLDWMIYFFNWKKKKLWFTNILKYHFDRLSYANWPLSYLSKQSKAISVIQLCK